MREKNKPIKIAIIGGGITGLVAGFYLAKKKYQVTIFEASEKLGGLAKGFLPQRSNWQWPIEIFYHHLFSNDKEFLDFSRQVGFKNVIFKKPLTSSLFSYKTKLVKYPLDTPKDLIRLPIINFIERLKTGVMVLFFKITPFLKIFEQSTSQQFITTFSGKKVWERMWQGLFRKKFGKYTGIILTSFMWARIKKRTKTLGYIKGGFQSFIDYLEQLNIKNNVKINTSVTINNIIKKNNQFNINNQFFNIIIATTPTQITLNYSKNVLPKTYLNSLKKIKYLNALVLLIETDKPVLNNTYWLNINAGYTPIMVFVQHTNFISKKHYNNKHLAYIGFYLDQDHKFLKTKKNKLLELLLPDIKKLADNKDFKITNSYKFVGPYAQAIFDQEFVKIKPEYKTPVKNFYLANLDMTYPYDRGTNFAVKMGVDIADLVKSSQVNSI